MEGLKPLLVFVGFLAHELSTTQRVVRVVEKLVAMILPFQQPAREEMTRAESTSRIDQIIREKEGFLNLPEENERETLNLWWEDQ